MYVSVPNIINPMFTQQLTEMILPPIFILLDYCNHLTYAPLHSRRVTLKQTVTDNNKTSLGLHVHCMTLGAFVCMQMHLTHLRSSQFYCKFYSF